MFTTPAADDHPTVTIQLLGRKRALTEVSLGANGMLKFGTVEGVSRNSELNPKSGSKTSIPSQLQDSTSERDTKRMRTEHRAVVLRSLWRHPFRSARR